MKTKSKARTSSVSISCLAAQVLGHTRVADEAFTSRRLSIAFPTFNTQELCNAISELLDKQLLKQKGSETNPTYSLTDQGREGPVSVS
jgi:hypothetical protein